MVVYGQITEQRFSMKKYQIWNLNKKFKILERLKTKVPPPIITLMFIFINYSLTYLDAPLEIPLGNFVSLFLLIAGFLIIMRAGILFARSKTIISPLEPYKSTFFVSNDIYKYTRNPMYLGLLIIYLSTIILFQNFLGFLLIPAFILYINYFQIIPEENALKDLFGPEYDLYLDKVRRWI